MSQKLIVLGILCSFKYNLNNPKNIIQRFQYLGKLNDSKSSQCSCLNRMTFAAIRSFLLLSQSIINSIDRNCLHEANCAANKAWISSSIFTAVKTLLGGLFAQLITLCGCVSMFSLTNSILPFN